MSYCRWAWDDSDVYAYETAPGRVAVHTGDGVCWDFGLTYKQALDELLAARERGLNVPQYAIDGLIADADNAATTEGTHGTCG